jgi:hypothetical protein
VKRRKGRPVFTSLVGVDGTLFGLAQDGRIWVYHGPGGSGTIGGRYGPGWQLLDGDDYVLVEEDTVL